MVVDSATHMAASQAVPPRRAIPVKSLKLKCPAITDKDVAAVSGELLVITLLTTAPSKVKTEDNDPRKRTTVVEHRALGPLP